MPKRELLVVDDEATICEVLRAFFTTKGFHVATAPTIQAALQQFHKTPAEVVVLDVKLPDGSGLDLLSTLKAQFPELRAIVISGVADEQTMQEAYERGASDCLSKPVDFLQCFYAAIGIETIDVARLVDIDREALARVPAERAQRYRVLPVGFRDGRLAMAMADPLDTQHIEELKSLVGCEIVPLAAIGGGFAEALHRWYGLGDLNAALPDAALTRTSPPFEDAPAVERLASDLIRHAHANRATDLHLGIDVQGPWVRERIDGILFDAPIPPQIGAVYGRVIAHLKTIAHLDTAERRFPQIGQVWFELDRTTLDLRISVVPGSHGESVAIQVRQPAPTLHLDQLGLSDEQRSQLQSLVAKPNGFLLITSPAGSGKSTILATLLSQVRAGCANIMTIEDPIAYELPGLTQIPAQPALGLTVACGLRAILQHDPDVIMVGELADQETALLATQAAVAGQLVLAGCSTPDAASAITRLLDFRVEPFVVCSALSAVLSVRLVRLLCQPCRESFQIDASQLASMGLTAPAQSSVVSLWRSRGCAQCRHTGYQGRTGIFELLLVDHHIRSLILKRTASAQLRQSAISRGMMSLWQSGWQKAQAGLTSLQELVRVLPP